MSHAPAHDYSAESSPRHCQNCGVRLAGPYCSQCGQHDVDYHRSFHVLVHDLLENLFHFEGKFFVTVAWLVAFPGRLTRDFLAGRRQRQVNPVRLYLFVSVAFFVGATLLNHGHLLSYDRAALDELQLTVNEDGDAVAGGPASEQKSVRKLNQLFTDAAGADSAATDGVAQLAAESARRQAAPAAAAAPPPSHNAQTSATREEGADALGSKLERKLAGGKLTLSQIWEAIEHRIPTFFFLGVPLFALWLKLIFRRPGRYYIEHLVFSLHLHTWAFLIAILGFGYGELFALGPNWLGVAFDWALSAWMVAHVVLSFRSIYALSWPGTLLRLTMLLIVHATALLMLALAIVILTVAWLAST